MQCLRPRYFCIKAKAHGINSDDIKSHNQWKIFPQQSCLPSNLHACFHRCRLCCRTTFYHIDRCVGRGARIAFSNGSLQSTEEIARSNVHRGRDAADSFISAHILLHHVQSTVWFHHVVGAFSFVLGLVQMLPKAFKTRRTLGVSFHVRCRRAELPTHKQRWAWRDHVPL